MRKEDFLKKMDELKPKLKNIVVEVDESLPADYAIGCYFEKKIIPGGCIVKHYRIKVTNWI